jgi:predicted DNA-binding transcriptional regulator YafY
LANSKHAHLRYNILDYCFRNKNFDFDELLDYLNQKIADYYPGEGVSVRTLRQDIKLFKDPSGFGAPLSNMSRIYKYSDPNFSIALKPLLDYEQYLIEASQQLLERFENDPKYDRLSEALIKFQDEEDEQTDINKILYYDHNEEYKGIKFLKPFYHAIKKRQVLEIKYKGFGKTNDEIFEFHPQVLKQYNRRWFVFGINNTKQNRKWSIPLDDRLIEFEILEDTEYLTVNNDWDSFFRTMVGVVRPQDSEIVNVVLRFHNGREEYFKTKPFHPDWDTPVEKDKNNLVYFDTIINKELIQQILSYGKDIEVLAPDELKIELKNQAISMHDLYSE